MIVNNKFKSYNENFILKRNDIPNNIKLALINEAFYGTSPLVNELVGEFAKIKNIVNSNKNFAAVYGTPEFKKACNNIERISIELFGLKDCTFICEPLIDMGVISLIDFIPLATSTRSGTLTRINKIEKGKYGATKNIKIVVYFGLHFFLLSNLTPRHLTAIYLHEVGHNFSNSIGTTLGRFLEVMTTQFYILKTISVEMAIKDVIGTTAYKTAVDDVKKIVSIYGEKLFRILKLDVLYGNLYKIFGFIFSPLMKIEQSFNFLFGQLLALFSQITHLIGIFSINPLLYGGMYLIQSSLLNKEEVYADNFAASYGFGKEITEFRTMYPTVTALQASLKNLGINLNKNGSFTSLLEFFSTVQDFLCGLIDLTGHPSGQAVIENILYKLKQDAQKCDPRVKAELEKNIKDMEVIKEKFLEIKPDDGIISMITKFFRKAIHACSFNTGGSIGNAINSRLLKYTSKLPD